MKVKDLKIKLQQMKDDDDILLFSVESERFEEFNLFYCDWKQVSIVTPIKKWVTGKFETLRIYKKL